MVEFWIHRKCAREGDELVLPKTYKDTSCEYCGKTIDKVFLHEGVGENWTAPVEAVEVTDTISDMQEKVDDLPVKLVDKEGEEVTVEEVFEKVIERTEEKVKKAVEAVSEPSVEIGADVKSWDFLEAKNMVSIKEAEIAVLKAKLEALEK